jgi:hypothetical protein
VEIGRRTRPKVPRTVKTSGGSAETVPVMDLIAARIIGRINARNDKTLLVTVRKTGGSGLINAFKRLNSKEMDEYLLKTREKALFLMAFILNLMAVT